MHGAGETACASSAVPQLVLAVSEASLQNAALPQTDASATTSSAITRRSPPFNACPENVQSSAPVEPGAGELPDAPAPEIAAAETVAADADYVPPRAILAKPARLPSTGTPKRRTGPPATWAV